MIIKCDKDDCDWRQEIDDSDLDDWLNVKCPKCQDCVIITPEDITFYYVMKGLERAGKALNIKGPKVQVDSAFLRKLDL